MKAVANFYTMPFKSGLRPLISKTYHVMSRNASSSAIAICHDKYGDPAKVLRLKTIPLPEVTSKVVKIKFIAAPINPADINQIQGVYAVKPTFNPDFGAIGGSEGLAEVVEVGSDVKDFQKGDWVIPAIAGWGTWRDFAVASPEEIIKLNIRAGDGVSALSAATISVNSSTAYRMLKDFVQLKPGDLIIQNGGNSGVGQAVIQLASAWGIISVNIVRSRPDLQDLVKKLKDLGATLVLTEEDIAAPTAKEQIKGLKAPPIRLALNCVGGTNASNMARLLGVLCEAKVLNQKHSDAAHIVTYGAMARQPLCLPASAYIFKDISTHGYWMTRWHRQNSVQARLDMLDELFDLIRRGKLKEPWANYHDIKDVSEASQEALLSLVGNALQGFSAGKTVLRIGN